MTEKINVESSLDNDGAIVHVATFFPHVDLFTASIACAHPSTIDPQQVMRMFPRRSGTPT